MSIEDGHELRLANYHKGNRNVTNDARLTSLKKKLAEPKGNSMH